jgi:hypothetical protein
MAVLKYAVPQPKCASYLNIAVGRWPSFRVRATALGMLHRLSAQGRGVQGARCVDRAANPIWQRVRHLTAGAALQRPRPCRDSHYLPKSSRAVAVPGCGVKGSPNSKERAPQVS